ncbi:hypothetical protein MSAN_00145300 [Mycena sanguinolenta]|uniref:Uncharacterized protein n=1 Tax=Mycena sanguinolenta TaxID=230812 RepID=A0A8H6ZDY4_9AGAR|nr:hypothetical protein MSAN_00145300 [Mycena sanguinolenta]
MAERSTSGTREPITSSGRGGVGNMHAPAAADRTVGGPDDFSDTRGREPPVPPLSPASRARSTGRGGVGNFRSPSRDPADNKDVRAPGEKEVIRKHEELEKEMGVTSTGRGGAGNISASRERGAVSPVRNEVHSSGRGGAGNIVPGPAPAYERGRAPADGVHSTGRGGLANLTASPPPPPEHHAHPHAAHAYESSGRGGAGNIRDLSASRSRERTSSKERGTDKGGIAGLWNRLHGGHHSPAHETIPEGQAQSQKPVAAVEPAVELNVGGGGRGGVVGARSVCVTFPARVYSRHGHLFDDLLAGIDFEPLILCTPSLFSSSVYPSFLPS